MSRTEPVSKATRGLPGEALTTKTPATAEASGLFGDATMTRVPVSRGFRAAVSRRPVVSSSLVSAALLGLVGAGLWASSPPANAQPAPSASSGPAATGSAEAPSGTGATPVRIKEYSWPADASPEPTDAEWSTAIPLQIERVTAGWRASRDECAVGAVREWVRVTCSSPKIDSRDDSPAMFGLVWGLAGDVTGVKTSLPPATTLERFKSPTTDPIDAVLRRAAAAAVVWFQARPGLSILVRMEHLGAAWMNYSDSVGVMVSPGPVLDASWAPGEKAPSLALR